MDMQRLKTRAQFQAAMSGGVIARSAHFALHRLVLESAQVAADTIPSGPGFLPPVQGPQALFAVPGQAYPQVWMGPLVPKRWAKRSVTRHAIKRQVYAAAEACAPQLQALPAQAAYVVRLRAGFDRKHFISACSDTLKAAVRAELQQLFASAIRRAQQPAKAQPASAPPVSEGVV